jgi:hypothetical protein|tara:strand:- start:259 stop:549 length:291 start_codon:yes stop_codon:yes gene_type:complete
MALSKADKDFIKKSVQDARDEILDAIGEKLEGNLKRALRMNSPKGRRKTSKTSSVKKELKDAWKCSCREKPFSKNGIASHKQWALAKGHKIKKVKL